MTIQNFRSNQCGCETARVSHDLLSLDAALKHCVLASDPVTGSEVVPLRDAVGRVLSVPLKSATSVPPFSNSAVDGYAVRVADLDGPGPWRLPLSAKIAAGDAPSRLVPASAARILTGAPIPEGADAVIAQESVTAAENQLVCIAARPEPGANIRRVGEDVAEGAPILHDLRRLTRRDIALAAASGAQRVDVRRKVRIAVLITGSEVVASGGGLELGEIHDVNGPMLRVAIEAPGVELVQIVHACDSREAIRDLLGNLAERVDLIVTTGGVSVGDEDYLHSAFRDAGGDLHFAGVAMKPGKPLSFGRIGACAWLGLPGNPYAAFVGWHIFGRTLVGAMQGTRSCSEARLVHTLHDITHRTGRCEMRPARITGQDAMGRTLVRAARATNSGRVRPLAEADGFVILPAENASFESGSLLEFIPFTDF